MISEFYAQLVVSKLIPEMECTSSFCYFKNQECTNPDLQKFVKMTFNLNDNVGKTVSLIIQPKDLLISGDKLGKSQNDCHLVVFAHRNSQENAIYLGNIVLQKYLTVFDASPYDERNQNFVQIGIANSAPKDKVKTDLMLINEAKKDAWEQNEKNKKEEELQKEQSEER